MKKLLTVAFAAPFLSIMLQSGITAPKAIAADNYYAGKPVRLVVGFTPGGFYDRWARHLARFMPKFIPGKPDFIVQNMPGGGSRTAANYLYTAAKPDGLTFGTVNKNLFFDQLADNKLVKFDWRKYTWIGSPERPPDILYIRTDSNVATLDDAKAAKRPLKCGFTAKSNSGYILPKAIEQATGVKFHIVLGYKGGREIDLAVERKEVECRSMSITPYLGRELFLTWHKNKLVRPLIQTGKEPFKGAPEVPSLFDMLKKHNAKAEEFEFIELITSSSEFGRPFVGPPGIPAARTEILRKAFDVVLNDTEAQNEAKRVNLEADPVPGGTLETMADKVMSTSPDTVNRFKALIGKK